MYAQQRALGSRSLLLLDTAALHTVGDKAGTGRKPYVGLVKKVYCILLCANSLLTHAYLYAGPKMFSSLHRFLSG